MKHEALNFSFRLGPLQIAGGRSRFTCLHCLRQPNVNLDLGKNRSSAALPANALKIMRLPFLPVILSLQTLLTPLVSAIFADEAYQVDYQHLLLGAPQRDTTFFHRPSATSKASLLYTLSEKLVLGAVNPKDGAVVWRQWLKDFAKEENEKGFLKALGGQDVVVSAVGAEIQAWDAADGRLVWSWRGDGLVRSLEVVDIEGMRGDVVAVTEGNGKVFVTRLSASLGDVVWKYEDTRYVKNLTGWFCDTKSDWQ